MKKILVLLAHPAPRHSVTNGQLSTVAQSIDGVTFVDLYKDYPRFKINIEAEQARLEEHDIILFQFPLMWYSTPSLLKEWQDLVLEYGYAYGEGGTALKGKFLLPVVSAGGPENAYDADGYNNFDLRTFLTPLEQTADLCHMTYISPYAIYASLRAIKDGRLDLHTSQYKALLCALRDDKFDYKQAAKLDILTCENLPLKQGAK